MSRPARPGGIEEHAASCHALHGVVFYPHVFQPAAGTVIVARIRADLLHLRACKRFRKRFGHSVILQPQRFSIPDVVDIVNVAIGHHDVFHRARFYRRHIHAAFRFLRRNFKPAHADVARLDFHARAVLVGHDFRVLFFFRRFVGAVNAHKQRRFFRRFEIFQRQRAVKCCSRFEKQLHGLVLRNAFRNRVRFGKRLFRFFGACAVIRVVARFAVEIIHRVLRFVFRSDCRVIGRRKFADIFGCRGRGLIAAVLFTVVRGGMIRRARTRQQQRRGKRQCYTKFVSHDFLSLKVKFFILSVLQPHGIVAFFAHGQHGISHGQRDQCKV